MDRERLKLRKEGETMNYLSLLQEELADAQRRLNSAEIEGAAIIREEISMIQRDIVRNSKNERD